ncbi:hypothetical protein H0266_04500 [Halobacillus locisalis]|uniref:Uncharacterized protein n=1 Tax=Halobacillus locisalis TaxID=220753 RepID=A0A838CQP8_9BACI|nr:hypothetical protein [Halobacillus locisalis]MBA2174159.1 hypothetical protein [Halobacillus locisalis]
MKKKRSIKNPKVGACPFPIKKWMLVIEDIIKTSEENESEEIQRVLDALDLSMEEYFWDYAYENYRYSLLSKKLFNQYIESGKVDQWDADVDQWVEEFKEDNEQEINELLRHY